jgi:GNAT superfamily N-acetyltransferase
MTTAPTPTSSARRDPAYARALAFERALHDAEGRTRPIPRGVLLSDAAHPLVWDVNTLWIDDAAGASAADLIADARRLQGPLGLTHRSVLVADETDWARLAPAFEEAGWMLQVNVVMAHDRRALPSPEHPIVEPTRTALRAAAAAYIASEPWGADPEAAREVLEHVVRVPPGRSERWLAVESDGTVVAYARLWSADGVAQVEDVVVLAPWRRRGLGRAIVAAATRAGLSLHPGLLFIVADDDDWPKRLYAQLGYRPVGRLALFRQMSALD